MPLSAIITGAIIDIAKKELFAAGKKMLHPFMDSASGKTLGQLICYRQQEGYNNVLLFVHGFSGNAAETFGVLPDMLMKDPKFKGWDIFSIGYSSDIFPSIGKGLWSVNPDIGKVSLYLRTLVRNQFGDYKRIAFVGHSMGGLAVQRTILSLSDDEQQKLSHVLFFGTPSAGLEKAFWVRFWNTQLHDLSSKSEFVQNLRKDWAAKFNNVFPFSFKTIAGSKDEFVPEASSLQPFEEQYHGIIEGNHINMIKPKDENDIHQESFEIILKTLTNQQVQCLKGNAEDINLLLGDYNAIIQKLLPNAKEITLNNLRDLVFALECTGRGTEALQVLQQHPKAEGDSDTLGIIGGRHKRKYLLDGLQTDLDKAFDYYKKALAIAQGKTPADSKQIYYHAINLAFLSIVANNNEMDMRMYAKLALDNCNADSMNMWEVATIAESNLYLGNMVKAEDYYKKTAELAGTNARDKQSVYSNAYYGYQSLTATKNKNAPFIKMLEETFL